MSNEETNQKSAQGAQRPIHERIVMKPCPFCGSASIEQGEALIERNGRRYSQAGCTDCGAFGPIKRCPDGINYGPDRDIESTRAWNFRAS